jgi:hypothetical protein
MTLGDAVVIGVAGAGVIGVVAASGAAGVPLPALGAAAGEPGIIGIAGDVAAPGAVPIMVVFAPGFGACMSGIDVFGAAVTAGGTTAGATGGVWAMATPPASCMAIPTIIKRCI